MNRAFQIGEVDGGWGNEPAKHTIRLVLTTRTGVGASIVCNEPERCTDLNDGSCGVREMWDWDSAASFEGYGGPEIVLIESGLLINDADEYGINDWHLAPELNDSGVTS